ncbi:hypothetical protein OOZ15_13405 [Galbibacter sp. EGI 63066]|uniref:hypothetical protein n=1 Tax=Galbibacter sp. EGI 63066 TaxID=2993559 RepID=UPI00224980C3|nr:hypothetical protein [Galbibacter sp. EGI 63066]MCX2680944.1 hypothetical protein [Galbibacter sp. EGI 63066]
MNIAIVSLAIFLIVSPAIIARRAYFTKELSKSFTYKNTLQEIFSSIFLAGLLHSVWIVIVEGFGHKIDFDIIFKLLFNPNAIDDYGNITDNIYNIICYFISLTLIATILSYLFRNIVRYFKLDRKFSLLRYDNNWYYLFTGEVLDIKKYSKDKTISSDDVNQRVVDILAKTDEGEIIYRGNLVDFQLHKDNTVEYLVLSYPEKKIGSKTKVINSSYFVVPYNGILNLNLRYLSTTEEKEEDKENPSE